MTGLSFGGRVQEGGALAEPGDQVSARQRTADQAGVGAVAGQHEAVVGRPGGDLLDHLLLEGATLTGHRGRVTALAASPNGSWLASAGADGTVRLWRPADATPLAALPLDDHGLRACTWLSRQPPTVVLGGEMHLYVVEYRR